MHSALNRAQSVFGFFTTVAFVLGLLTALSVTLHPAEPVSSVALTNVQVVKGRPHYYSSKREEYAQIKFDLDADLSSLFNWNTKQLFVYVLATYPSSSSPNAQTTGTNFTESIIWDTIIPAPVSPFSFSSLKSRFFPSSSSSSFASSSRSKRPSNNSNKRNSSSKNGKPGILKLRDQKSKYQITDITGRLAEKQNVSLVVGWNVQPWIGALQWSPGANVANNLGSLFGFRVVTGGNAGRSSMFAFPALKGNKAESSSSTT
ncbi:hypothetical protein VTO42DRAFT_6792 [Malbranchea cinnamomea]